VFESWILRRIFGLKREEVEGGWIRLHNEELHNLYVSPNTIRVVKGRRMRWAGNVARAGEVRNVYRISVMKPESERPPEDLALGVDVRIMLQ
jgi:hypothetical protein